ncbi:MAG: dihydroorotate dehydrogenase [Spirochaetes bacterium]|uniref:Dihydroorotate dehydrogenase n=1 Tax=Candidatus Ornithospirochaeta stercoripullorum TaxID=2840899 RepID=A0A9D9H1M3_9SPIO|nr:dihydroorotate dehydrogenase [Candidatus Ornithospirochaeta stercoripullorum]
MDVNSLRHNHLKGAPILATVSGVASTKKELIELFDKKIPAIDIITTKSFQVTPNPGNREPIVCSPKAGDFGNSVGLRNPGMDVILPEIKEIRENGMRALLNISLSASNPEDFITLVKAFDVYADLLELNFSCPHAAAGFGASIGSDASIASSYVEAICKAYPERKALLIVKLTPNVPDIGAIAKAVIEAGADGIAAINTVGPKLYIEPNSGKPILNNKIGGKGGASGEWVNAEALEAIKAIRKAIGDDPIILGMGGVTRPEDVKAMIASGADSVGIGSALSRVMPTEWQNYLAAMKSGNSVSCYLSDKNMLEYTPHTVVKKEIHESGVMILTLSGKMECQPGEFVFIWLPESGEKPFSVAVNDPLTFLIKKRGIFTEALFNVKEGDTVYTRGLYGKEMKYQKSEKALLIGGGTGAAVLPLIGERLKKDGTVMDIRVGVAVPSSGKDPLQDVLETYGTYLSVADDGKPGRVLDTLTDKDVEGDVSAYVVGPGKMMEKAARQLETLGLSDKRIYLSMEKNTMCGIGMCGECVCGGHLPCKEGTFFTWKTLKENGAEL